MRSIVNLAVLSLLSLGIFTSKSNLLNPPELVEAPGNTPASNPAPIMNQTTPVPQNIDREITGGWQTILDENFSGSWPWSGWTVVDLKLDNKIIYWGTDQYRYHSSNSAAWPARGGRDGRDPTIKTNDYFNNMDTRMIFGPFDLSDASTANISFWIWWQTETTNDILKFEISHDNSTFIEYGRWSGTSAGWQQINLSLDQFRGDTSVWVSWRFMSNASVVYDGPWVDDIFLQKFVLGKITAHGTFSYTDRDNSLVPASYTLVNLYDLDYDGTTELLATTFTQSDGTFQFPHIVNGGDDDLEDPNPNLDLWVRWETIYNDSVLAQHSVKNFNNQSYKWYSDVEWNVMDGADQEFNYFITAQDSSLPAMWIFHDQRRAWEYYFYDTNPAVDPGSVTVKWEISKNELYPCNGSCFYGFGTYVFIADQSTISSDTIIHEIGHNYMYNLTQGWWLWWDINCYDHQLFSIEDQKCAWSEGWADFYSLMVNGDACYDFGIGPCTGYPDEQYYNLETHSRNDFYPFPKGDFVEGRIAGSLYDFIDFNWPYEGYDSAFFEFNQISTIIISTNIVEESFQDIWSSWKLFDFNKHHAVRAIFQNAIEYNTPPGFNQSLPIPNVFKNTRKYRALDLWPFSVDQESSDSDFIYSTVNNYGCDASISEGHYIEVMPWHDWLGYCTADIVISDTITETSTTLFVNVIPLASITYSPIILK